MTGESGGEEFGRVVFEREDDGTITARDLETGLARGGETRSEALAQLAEVLELHDGGGEPIGEEDMRELGLFPDEFDSWCR